jgi:VanZ family protein
MMGRVLHRHPFLGLLSVLYLGFVGLVTLTPGQGQPDYYALAERILARMQRYPDLDPLTYRLSPERIEFLANIALFVPLGVFLLLLVGTRLWWVALAAGIVLTSMIESVQGIIPGRVSDPRDVAANAIGMFVGIALALVLTLPGTLRRNRERQRERVGV